MLGWAVGSCVYAFLLEWPPNFMIVLGTFLTVHAHCYFFQTDSERVVEAAPVTSAQTIVHLLGYETALKWTPLSPTRSYSTAFFYYLFLPLYRTDSVFFRDSATGLVISLPTLGLSHVHEFAWTLRLQWVQ